MRNNECVYNELTAKCLIYWYLFRRGISEVVVEVKEGKTGMATYFE